MKARNSSPLSIVYIYALCCFVGAFIALLVPSTRVIPTGGSGMITKLIAFESDYIHLLNTLGTIWLLCWLIKGRIDRRGAMVLYVGLGFAATRLICTAFWSLR
jgi:hypothetical protein